MELSKVYSEVYEILNLLGNEYISKLPTKLFEHIYNKKDNSSMKEFDINKPINEQKISKETLEFISYLNLQYWSNEQEKNELLMHYKENDEKYDGELKARYNIDNLFTNVLEEDTACVKTDNVHLIKYKRENIFKEFLNKIIKKIFKKDK